MYRPLAEFRHDTPIRLPWLSKDFVFFPPAVREEISRGMAILRQMEAPVILMLTDLRVIRL
jgi:hypothetical protein